jgi:hypothetical protein
MSSKAQFLHIFFITSILYFHSLPSRYPTPTLRVPLLQQAAYIYSQGSRHTTQSKSWTMTPWANHKNVGLLKPNLTEDY